MAGAFLVAGFLALLATVLRNAQWRLAQASSAASSPSSPLSTWPHRGARDAWTVPRRARRAGAVRSRSLRDASGLVVLVAFCLALLVALAPRPADRGSSERRWLQVGFPQFSSRTDTPLAGLLALASLLWASVVLGAGDARQASSRHARRRALVVSGSAAMAGLFGGGQVDWRGGTRSQAARKRALPLERELHRHRLSGQTHGDASDPAPARASTGGCRPSRPSPTSLDRALYPEALAASRWLPTRSRHSAMRARELASAGGDGRGLDDLASRRDQAAHRRAASGASRSWAV